jgi:hypothetical protein
MTHCTETYRQCCTFWWFHPDIIEWRQGFEYHVISRKDDVIFDVTPATDAALVGTMSSFDFAESKGLLEKSIILKVTVSAAIRVAP